MGIGRVVLRDRENVMLMTAQENGIMLYRLRYPKEVRNIQDVPLLDGMVANPDELKLAQTLVDSMTTSFDKAAYKPLRPRR